MRSQRMLRNFTWKWLAGAFVFAGLMTTMAACSDDDNQCVAGKACACTGDCSQTCGGSSGAGCTFDCPEGATCTFSCPGGSCAAHGHDAKSVTVDCPGNSCTVDCTGTATDNCTVTSCTSACALNCGGATTCSNSCDLTGACTLSE
ncbi:MAG: hypothetical protein J7M25_00635 [Deltaproteobacteria bacterium]|nr:hypothetical protein [Deltaproteobacteria bacterium]